MRGKSWGVDNANALIEELRTAHPRIKIKLGTVANRQNHLEVPEIGAALYDKQVKINTWKIYQYTARRQFKHRWQGYHLPDDEFAALQSKIRNRIPDAPFNIVYSSNVSRGRAYVFVYPDGTVSIPNVGEKMEDLTLGNLYVEGRQVLDRVTGFCAENHWTNYHSTYPGSVTRTTGS
jgi:MoaA/NifB/PqqE/SkfB family radical SAM enzyme